jgi:hypothetical protein
MSRYTIDLECENWEWTSDYLKGLTPVRFDDNVFETNFEDNNRALSGNYLTALTPKEENKPNQDIADRTHRYECPGRTFATSFPALSNARVVTPTSRRTLMRHHQVGKE